MPLFVEVKGQSILDARLLAPLGLARQSADQAQDVEPVSAQKRYWAPTDQYAPLKPNGAERRE
jgi:hypothetical protein